jgi:asparagine synthase (glutamine-hydrolysing)
LDSSAILHYAAQSVPKLKTFSISFKGFSHDESRYFQEVAQAYGTEHHEFDLNPDEDMEGAIREMTYYSDEPSADAGALPVWFLSKMTRQHVTVALSGDGADELFGGYQTYVADRLAERVRRYPAWMRKLGLGALKLWPASDEKIGLDYKAKRFLEGSLLKPAAAHVFWNGTLNERDKRALYRAESYPSPGELLNTLPTEAHMQGALNRFLFLDQRYYLADDILVKCDRMSMAHSLEVRPPFLDHRIVQFAATLPEEYKIQGNSLKFILRDLMRDKLPQAVLKRPKEGFDIPTHRWFRTTLRPMMEEVLSPRAVRETGLFDVATMERLKREHLKRRANHGYALWGLVTLFLWMKRWNVETTVTA